MDVTLSAEELNMLRMTLKKMDIDGGDINDLDMQPHRVA